MSQIEKDPIDHVIEEICEYLEKKNIPHLENLYGGITFSTGVDTWMVFVEAVDLDSQKAAFTLLHRDNIHKPLNKRHRLYGGIPDFHIQKRIPLTDEILSPVYIAQQHNQKWEGKPLAIAQPITRLKSESEQRYKENE